MVVKDSYQEKAPQINDIYFGLLTASLADLAPYVPQFAGYACAFSELGDIDGFRGLCGKAGGLSVYWVDDSVEVFHPDGGVSTDEELSGDDRDTETHLRELALTVEGRAKLREAFGVDSDGQVLEKVREGATKE